MSGKLVVFDRAVKVHAYPQQVVKAGDIELSDHPICRIDGFSEVLIFNQYSI